MCTLDPKVEGLTPAFAGKTSSEPVTAAAIQAHPRIRGEDDRQAPVVWLGAGSPPHSRGRQSDEWTAWGMIGLTPAFAGKTRVYRVSSSTHRAHPRIRGEDQVVVEIHGRVQGSPPHSRGRQWVAAPGLVYWGLTPAFAGKTARNATGDRRRKAHPRIRGEDQFCTLTPAAQHGSPPHSRGRRHAPERWPGRDRLTPAFAGKTRYTNSGRPVVKAHPRIRGEDSLPGDRWGETDGSPPHSRGRHIVIHKIFSYARLTPAFAGKTGGPPAIRFVVEAHPRIRGEDSAPFNLTWAVAGSPPHSRGRQSARRVHEGPQWAHPRIRGEDLAPGS